MSDFGDLETELLARVATIISGVTTHVGFVPFNDIPADKYPFAMTADPEGAAERMEPYQNRQTITLNLILVAKGTDGPANVEVPKAWLDSIRANIEAAPTLAGLVDISWVSAWAIDEYPAEARVVGLVAVTAERGA